ncbi:hypothetical protein D2A34_08575 [Clostridium chromiireducens]|uniref:Uncharacterized protein n=1 Tax=Clostridium chromiireducens TaxID=225345 RepID=A0A399IQH8_9CLOT|nr:hypothetical protein D2A34_08575 [Clostridium chromiireducens]
MGSCSAFACPMLVKGACGSGATFHLDIPSEIFHSPVEHICILFRLVTTHFECFTIFIKNGGIYCD